MEMLSENVWAIIITVVSGVLVYIIGEILQTVWLAPLQKFKSIKHDVSVALTYYATDKKVSRICDGIQSVLSGIV